MTNNTEIRRLLRTLKTLSPTKNFSQSARTVRELNRALSTAGRRDGVPALTRLLHGRPGFSRSSLYRMFHYLRLPVAVQVTWDHTSGASRVVNDMNAALGRGASPASVVRVLRRGEEDGLRVADVQALLRKLPSASERTRR